jgi:pimeloyl-ACP methyl ester carboxylesterase
MYGCILGGRLALLGEQVTCHTLDLPGFGASPPFDGDLTVAALAQVVEGWMTELQLGPAVVIGHSLGGIQGVRRYPVNEDLRDCER